MQENAPVTTRPNHPVVSALENGTFLERMFELLAPAEWFVPTDTGFWWIPHRVQHSIDIFETVNEKNEPVPACRSTFLMVVDIENEDEAIARCHYLNQKSCGGAYWYDEDARTISMTSSVHLDPANWFAAFVFESTITRMVGVCETLASPTAAMVGGKVADPVHPEHGRRSTPDQFVDETLLVTRPPEATLGLWWSRSELNAFRRCLRFQLQVGGHDDLADQIDRSEFDEDLTSGQQLAEEIRFDREDDWVSLTVQEGRHPDFGVGIEMLLCSSYLVGDDYGFEGPPESDGLAMSVANILNELNHEACGPSLCLGGWTSWRGQLVHDTYVMPEVASILQNLAMPHAGEVLGLMAGGLLSHVIALDWSLEEADLYGAPRTCIGERRWAGLRQNAGYHSLLVNDEEVFDPIVQRLPLNQLIDPIELDSLAFTVQTEQTVASMGIFNPAGPTVGSIEVAINYRLARALLVERVRHPISPYIRLHAVLDLDGFMQIHTFLAPIVAAMPWDPFDWFEFRTGTDDDAAALSAGLRRFAERRPDIDFGYEALALLDTLDDPWDRLARDYRPPFEFGPDADGIEAWIGAISDPRNIDNHYAFIRSAWEGTAAWSRSHDNEAAAHAQRMTDRVRSNVRTRKGLWVP